MNEGDKLEAEKLALLKKMSKAIDPSVMERIRLITEIADKLDPPRPPLETTTIHTENHDA